MFFLKFYDYFLLWLDAYQIAYEAKTSNALALTFDDGPHPDYTPKLLDILGRSHVQATFFLVGEQAKRYPALVKRIVHEGHEIGNHSWSHGLSLLQTKTRQRHEIEKTQQLLHELSGVAPRWFRPPYGIFGFGMSDILEEQALKPMLWNQSLWDYKKQTLSELSHYLKKGLDKAPCVYLMHDGNCSAVYQNRQPTLDCLKVALPELLNQGHQFDTLSTLFCEQRACL